MTSSSRVMVAVARFYEDIADQLVAGATAALDEAGASHEIVEVPGALELPTAILFGHESGRFDAFVALGCVVRGQTAHYDIVAGESARGLMDLGVQYGLAIGNGILTTETRGQAKERAAVDRRDKGGDAARAALSLLTLKTRFAEQEK